ncbi:hypothetical protein BRADI_1g57836v3 [Brachypodium distachyon]|uniref:Uncharacterized protein n=1 Tax=Brachypodium distachyon TaxID=15368 RepID=A0A0Q3NU00_BRADI|nr:hypothetical protein BRADI_1g57836v3 [Brachypodium distachyon]
MQEQCICYRVRQTDPCLLDRRLTSEAGNVMRTWFRSLSPAELERFISIAGITLEQQLAGDAILDHEVCSIICHRVGQIDATNGAYWRLIIEPDFASNVLCDVKAPQLRLIHTQLGGTKGRFHTAAARLFLAPSILDNVWTCYAWDMKVCMPYWWE